MIRYLFLITLAFIGPACSSDKKTTATAETTEPDTVTLSAEQVKAIGLETGTVEKHLLNSELQVNGIVDVPPQNMVSVSFPLGGYLKTTRLLPGMQVSKGEVIAVMEDQALIQLQQDFLVAKAKLGFLEKEFERQKMLNENKVNADKVFQQTETDFLSQKVLVRGYGEKLRLTGINPDKLNENTISRSVPVFSPISGFVSKVNVNIGKYVNPSDVLFELINPADIHAALTVFEKDLGKLKAGQKVMVTFVDDPATVYECEVLLITKNVDDNRSALVHCHFENRPRQLLPGMFLKARIRINNAEVLAVPEEALLRYGNEEFLLEAIGSNRYRLLAVQTGTRDGGMVEVMTDKMELAGKTIITRNAYPVFSRLKNTGSE